MVRSPIVLPNAAPAAPVVVTSRPATIVEWSLTDRATAHPRAGTIEKIAYEHKLRAAHWGTDGSDSGVWGLDKSDRITFIIVGRGVK